VHTQAAERPLHYALPKAKDTKPGLEKHRGGHARRPCAAGSHAD